MNENKQFKICDVLGIELNEKFGIKMLNSKTNKVERVWPIIISSDNGYDYSVLWPHDVIWNTGIFSTAKILLYAINHPESIIHGSILTEKEVIICQELGAKWVTKDKELTALVKLWDWSRPAMINGVYNGYTEGERCSKLLCTINKDFFPSVTSGDCIHVSELY